MSSLPSPGKEYWNEVNRVLFKFLANNKQEKLKRNTLIGQYDEGGFKWWILKVKIEQSK